MRILLTGSEHGLSNAITSLSIWIILIGWSNTGVSCLIVWYFISVQFVQNLVLFHSFVLLLFFLFIYCFHLDAVDMIKHGKKMPVIGTETFFVITVRWTQIEEEKQKEPKLNRNRVSFDDLLRIKLCECLSRHVWSIHVLFILFLITSI